MERYDIAIVGSGPAGLSAALNAKIRNKKFITMYAFEWKLKGVNFKMRKNANNRGITLIALVVTIIVILILARR